MAKGKGQINGWITKNGVHIPIYEHYSVRGGEEPKTKGARFKGKKKENWNVEHVRNDIFQSNTSVKEQADYIDYLHKKGKINDEEKATLSKELADRHKNRISEDVGAVTSSDSKAAFEDETPGKTAQREKDADTRKAFRDKKAQEQGFADDASMRSYNEETGVNKETWKATPESYAQSKGKSIRDIAQEVNNNDAARATANQLMKDGRTYEEAAALAHSDMERGTLKGQESSTSNFGSMSDKELVDAYRNSTDKNERYKIASRLNVRGYSLQPDRESWQKTGSPADESKFGQRARDYKASLQQSGGKKPASAKVSRIIHGDEQTSSTPKTNKTDAYNDKVFADFKKNGKDYQRVPMEGYAGTANDFRAAAKRAGVEIEYDKGDDTFYLRKSTETSNAGSRYKTKQELSDENGTTTQGMAKTIKGMTITSLKAAFSKATGGEKAMLKSELLTRGYKLVNGKWTKK